MNSVFASLPPLAGAVIGLVVGLGLGLVHFATLKKVTALYLSGAATLRVAGLQLARFVLLAAALALLALWGGLPLLSGALGVLAGRAIVLRRSGGMR